MEKSRLLGAVCACFFAVHLSTTLAERIRISIVAEVTDVSDPGSILDGTITIGDTLRGTYTYDTTAANVNPLPTIGEYEYYNPPFGISINGGTHTFETTVLYKTVLLTSTFYGNLKIGQLQPYRVQICLQHHLICRTGSP